MANRQVPEDGQGGTRPGPAPEAPEKKRNLKQLAFIIGAFIVIAVTVVISQ